MNSSSECHEIAGFPSLFVDAFRGHYLRKTTDPDNTFVLTHYHGDHYGNLPRDGKYQGPALIHCTPVTAKLLIQIHRVPPTYVVEHAYGDTFTIHAKPSQSAPASTTASARPLQQRANLTFYDANHCPGACIVLVQLADKLLNGDYQVNTTHLHTGDMRYHEKMKSYPLLREAVLNRTLDLVYLDTTYGSHAKHDFVPQQEAIEAIASQSAQMLTADAAANDGENVAPTLSTLILLSCYSIGKERVLWEASTRTNQLIHVSAKKKKMLECLLQDESSRLGDGGGGDLSSQIIQRCTLDPSESDIHVIPMGLAGEMWPFFRPNYLKCAEYVLEKKLQDRYDRVVAFIPTGWAHGSNWNKKNAVSRKTVKYKPDQRAPSETPTYDDDSSTERRSSIQVEIRLISYSEHSSFSELTSFVEFLRPRKVIPTVFSNDADRRKMEKHFFHLLDNNRVKQAFFQSMKQKGTRMSTQEDHHSQGKQIAAHTDTKPNLQAETIISVKKRKQADSTNFSVKQSTEPECPSVGWLTKKNDRFGSERIGKVALKSDTSMDEDVEAVIVVRPSPRASSSSTLRTHPDERPETSFGPNCVDHIVNMGFSWEESKKALEISGGNLQVAIDILLSAGNGSSSETETTGRDGARAKTTLSTTSKAKLSNSPVEAAPSKVTTAIKEKSKKLRGPQQSSSPTITRFFSVVKKS
jgi:hypothetical protein